MAPASRVIDELSTSMSTPLLWTTVPPVLAVVEIAPSSEARLRAHLVSAAYRASRAGIVVLVLQNVARASVDELLDPVVHSIGSSVCGVLYLDSRQEAEVRWAVERTPLVVASTAEFHSMCMPVARRLLRAEEIFFMSGLGGGLSDELAQLPELSDAYLS